MCAQTNNRQTKQKPERQHVAAASSSINIRCTRRCVSHSLFRHRCALTRTDNCGPKCMCLQTHDTNTHKTHRHRACHFGRVPAIRFGNKQNQNCRSERERKKKTKEVLTKRGEKTAEIVAESVCFCQCVWKSACYHFVASYTKWLNDRILKKSTHTQNSSKRRKKTTISAI